jgi:predicted lactoylglutathione lyase
MSLQTMTANGASIDAGAGHHKPRFPKRRKPDRLNAMEQRVSLITLGVADLAASTAFYERLGWKRSMPGAEGVVFFQAGGMGLALYPFANLAADAGLKPESAGSAAMALAYNARSRVETDAVLAEAGAAGASVVKPAEDTFWGGYAGYFRDLDGHLWEVAWNPGFALAQDGSITLPQ